MHILKKSATKRLHKQLWKADPLHDRLGCRRVIRPLHPELMEDNESLWKMNRQEREGEEKKGEPLLTARTE